MTLKFPNLCGVIVRYCYCIFCVPRYDDVIVLQGYVVHKRTTVYRCFYRAKSVLRTSYMHCPNIFSADQCSKSAIRHYVSTETKHIFMFKVSVFPSVHNCPDLVIYTSLKNCSSYHKLELKGNTRFRVCESVFW
jgi:hypothetical protein